MVKELLLPDPVSCIDLYSGYCQFGGYRLDNGGASCNKGGTGKPGQIAQIGITNNEAVVGSVHDFSNSIKSRCMFSNYFKIACRNLARNKGFSFTNILGLSIGIVCTI